MKESTNSEGSAISAENILAREFLLSRATVSRIRELLAEGNTVPFLARYRRDRIDNLDAPALRRFAARSEQLERLFERREQIFRLLEEGGNLTPELKRHITRADTLAELEELYRPYRSRRETRGERAKRAGLTSLADYLLSEGGREAELKKRAYTALQTVPQKYRQYYGDTDAVIAGAQDIIAERIALRPDLRRELFTRMKKTTAVKVTKKTDEKSVFDTYDDFDRPLTELSPHQILAIRRGEQDGILKQSFRTDDDGARQLATRKLNDVMPRQSRLRGMLYATVEDSLNRLLYPSLFNRLWREQLTAAETEAMQLFARNSKDLLMRPPLKDKVILGLDPGFAHGLKWAVIDAQGNLLEAGTWYLFDGKGERLRAEGELNDVIADRRVDVIALGNGTASRETEAFLAECLDRSDRDIGWIVVDEAGASVYSASETAIREFPDLDMNLRSAVSIARRLMDPLSELVKINPESIGVGLYQHDLDSKKLHAYLTDVVEDCVNDVGVDVNTASAELLRYVAGINRRQADAIVTYREQHGPFKSREALKAVPYFGAKTFEQAAGFLRIADADNPLDRTRVHPERYALVNRIAADAGIPVGTALGAMIAEEIDTLGKAYAADHYTLEQIADALLMPEYDPRGAEQPAMTRKLQTVDDLKTGMMLDGVVRNVTSFGAFVDVGVEYDGLVHLSQLADKYVNDPFTVVRTGQRVRVRVLKNDRDRRRLELSMKSTERRKS